MTELQKFALENRVLFWDMSEKAISNLSEGAITERFLSYGDWKQVHKLEAILWHRESIDFDLFHPNGFDQTKIRIVMNQGKANFSSLMVSREGESTSMVDGVKVTFFHYHFLIEACEISTGT